MLNKNMNKDRIYGKLIIVSKVVNYFYKEIGIISTKLEY